MIGDRVLLLSPDACACLLQGTYSAAESLSDSAAAPAAEAAAAAGAGGPGQQPAQLADDVAEPEASEVEPAKDTAADAAAEEAADAAAEEAADAVAEDAAVQAAQPNSQACDHSEDPASVDLADFLWEEEPVIWSRRLRSGRVVQVVLIAVIWKTWMRNIHLSLSMSMTLDSMAGVADTVYGGQNLLTFSPLICAVGSCQLVRWSAQKADSCV